MASHITNSSESAVHFTRRDGRKNIYRNFISVQQHTSVQAYYYQTDNFTFAESSNKLGYMATLRLRADGIISEL